MNIFSLISGAMVLAILWLMPWASLGLGPFSAHMIVHMGIVAVAAPLLALGLANAAFNPVQRAPWLFAPVPVSLFEFIVVWAWHTPLLHQSARHSHFALFAEQGLFLLAGLWLWLAAFGRPGSGVVALLLTSMHMTLLGALFALAPRPLFTHNEVGSPWGSHAAPIFLLTDLHMGGAIMILTGGLAYLAGGLWLTAGLLRSTVGRVEL